MLITYGKGFSKSVVLLLVSVAAVLAYALLLNTLPLADLAKEFGIPAVVGNALVQALDWGLTAATIVSIIGAFITGGLSIVAAAGTTALKTYLRNKLTEMGTKAFVAW
ncbi:uberolysin/carnocyclin family circular bacteriocin [Paenibacillus ferrarius]|uniref:uberolysin/carnocyclin family circular bacteriocin n=1 Tax=Paenibacillus ferrarius TaxID=1469647 RepID=UPI0009A4B672|nr:uberolysin/carnocyclin family circular bacteriocin [Paenibacillus ferrarius]